MSDDRIPDIAIINEAKIRLDGPIQEFAREVYGQGVIVKDWVLACEFMSPDDEPLMSMSWSVQTSPLKFAGWAEFIYRRLRQIANVFIEG